MGNSVVCWVLGWWNDIKQDERLIAAEQPNKLVAFLCSIVRSLGLSCNDRNWISCVSSGSQDSLHSSLCSIEAMARYGASTLMSESRTPDIL